jgi:hypothetical protein
MESQRKTLSKTLLLKLVPLDSPFKLDLRGFAKDDIHFKYFLITSS